MQAESTLSANLAIRRQALTGRVVGGAILGLAWGAGLRGWMAVFARRLQCSRCDAIRRVYACALHAHRARHLHLLLWRPGPYRSRHGWHARCRAIGVAL